MTTSNAVKRIHNDRSQNNKLIVDNITPPQESITSTTIGTRLMECMPVNEKVTNWLNQSFAKIVPIVSLRQCSVQSAHHQTIFPVPSLPMIAAATTEIAPHNANQRVPPAAANPTATNDDSSVDTTKYIKSNRTITRTKITTMIFKNYCLLSSNQNNNVLMAASALPPITRHRRKPPLGRNNNDPVIKSLIMPKKKRKIKYKIARHVSTAPSSSDDNDEVVCDNRFSRRLAKRRTAASNEKKALTIMLDRLWEPNGDVP